MAMAVHFEARILAETGFLRGLEFLALKVYY